jgi:hypothetical protein
MGTRGPVPARSETRAGHIAKANLPDKVTLTRPVPVPAPSKGWAPEATRWYRALKRSGQVRFFEPSDWQYAWLLAELLTKELTLVRVVHNELTGEDAVVPMPPRALMTKKILGAMGELGTTESSRRRMRIEVERAAPGAGEPDDNLTLLDDYRAALGE